MLLNIAGALVKLKYDDKYTLTYLKVGNIVYLRLSKDYYLPGKPKRKVLPLRAGLFKIIKVKVNSLAYKLDFLLY